MDKTKIKKITENIEYVSQKIDTIMQNRLIIAIFMIVDGICLIIDPIDKMEFIAKVIAFSAILASSTVIITNIKSKARNIKSIVMASIMIIICAGIIIFPEILAINVKVLIAIFIIFNGLINIFNIMKLDKLSSYISNTENKIKNKFDKNEKDKGFNKGVVLEQTEKISNPLNNFIEKTNKNSILYFILNIISVILGIVLLTTDTTALILCGIILIYTGTFDLLIFVKSKKLSKKLK